jgi:APA family basic amino acid/polyamine antiporter
MLLSTSFDQLMLYIGFTLSLFGALTVGCVFVLRRREVPRPFTMPGYPVVPIVFIGLMVWMIVAGVKEQPVAALYGVLTLAVGSLVYGVANRSRRATIDRDDR